MKPWHECKQKPILLITRDLAHQGRRRSIFNRCSAGIRFFRAHGIFSAVFCIRKRRIRETRDKENTIAFKRSVINIYPLISITWCARFRRNNHRTPDLPYWRCGDVNYSPSVRLVHASEDVNRASNRLITNMVRRDGDQHAAPSSFTVAR